MDLEETVVRERLLPNGQDQSILPYRGDARAGPMARRGTGPRPTVSGTFFNRIAGACPRDVERVMKYPHLIETGLSYLGTQTTLNKRFFHQFETYPLNRAHTNSGQ